MFRIRATNEYGISDPSLSATVFSKQTGAPTCAAGPLAFRVPDFVFGAFSEQKRRDFLRFELLFARFVTNGGVVWLGGVVVRALDLRLEIASSIPAAALSSATLDKLFTHIVQRL